MKTPDKGKDKILLFRLLEEATTEKAAKLALQVNHAWNYSRAVDTTQTKDGAITTVGGLIVTLNFDAISTNDDVNKMLAEAAKGGKKLEVWEIDLASKALKSQSETDYEYDALYAQGVIETWELPQDTEGFVEFSTPMFIDGEPQEGKVELSEEQEDEVQYAFRDLDEYVEPVAN